MTKTTFLVMIVSISIMSSLLKMKADESGLQTPYDWFNTQEYRLTLKLHSFHGINDGDASWTCEHGYKWFKRNGKKCALWDPDDPATRKQMCNCVNPY